MNTETPRQREEHQRECSGTFVLLMFVGTYVGALLCYSLLGLFVDGLSGFFFAIYAAMFFPWGLAVSVGFAPRLVIDDARFLLLGYVVYGALVLTALTVRRKAAVFSLWGLLLAALAVNAVGCQQMRRAAQFAGPGISEATVVPNEVPSADGAGPLQSAFATQGRATAEFLRWAEHHRNA